MVSVTCDVDQAAIDHLDALIDRVRSEMPGRLAAETRRAAIYVCQSLRSRTKVAPKRIRAPEYAATISVVAPKYIHSNSAGRRLLRRWTLARKLGTPDAYAKHYYVYTDRHRGKNGRMVGGSRSAELRELLQQHGGIPRSGLAKLSWGWVMKQIYGGASADFTWKPRRGERRDPRMDVKGVFSKSRTGALALIHNALDYISDALAPGALTESINAATRRMEYNIAAELSKVENAPVASAARRRGRGRSYEVAHGRADPRNGYRYTDTFPF